MNHTADTLLLAALMCGLYAVSTSRLLASIRATAMQGAFLALLPFAFWMNDRTASLTHVLFVAAVTAAAKAILIPWLLEKTMRSCNVEREVEPFVSLHASMFVAVALVAISFWLGRGLDLPEPPPSPLVFPVGFSLLMIGFLLLVNRKKAISEVVGFLVLENGVYVCGMSLHGEMPFLVEMGALLDLLVGVFVMGISLRHIGRAFDDIDVDLLSSLNG